MKTVYFFDRNFEAECNCCGQVKPGCRPIWLDPSDLQLLCPFCFSFIVGFLRSLEIEIKKGGE